MQRATAPNNQIARDSYHHGNLPEALIAAAIDLIAERGVETLSVREVAKRAGVSPGAPFRHFESKTALLTAVAQQAMDRFVSAVETALADWPSDDPIGAIRRMGDAYLGWAMANPVHFRIISSRELIDFHGSSRLLTQNAELQQTMRMWLQRAKTSGLLRPGLDIEIGLISCRAYVYGLARMWCDGHLRDWQGSLTSDTAMALSLDAFIGGLTHQSM